MWLHLSYHNFVQGTLHWFKDRLRLTDNHSERESRQLWPTCTCAYFHKINGNVCASVFVFCSWLWYRCTFHILNVQIYMCKNKSSDGIRTSNLQVSRQALLPLCHGTYLITRQWCFDLYIHTCMYEVNLFAQYNAPSNRNNTKGR